MKRIALLLPILFLLAACNRAPQEVTPTPTRPAAAVVSSPPAAQALVTATLPLSTPVGGRALATAALAGSATPVGTARALSTAGLPVGTPSAAGTARPLTTAALPVGTPSALATAALPLGTPGATGTARALTTATVPVGTPASGVALPLSTAALPVGTPSAGATPVVTLVPLLPVGTPSPTSAVATLAPQQLAGTPAAPTTAYPAPTSSAVPGAQMPATRYDAADAGISFDVPVGWQRQPGPQWLFAPAGATSPQLGMKWADMGSGWQPTSMLPASPTNVTVGTLTLPLGAATVFILPGAATPTPGGVAQAGEIHVVVATTNGRAYDFYGTANRVEDLLALQPALLQMVSSATLRR